MALGFFLLILLIVACAANEGRTPRTRGHLVGQKPSTPRPGGCGPLASHSAPPRANLTPRFVCGDCGQLRAPAVCECCAALAAGTAGVL